MWPKEGFCVSTKCPLQMAFQSLASCPLGSELGQQEGKVSIPLSPLSLWAPEGLSPSEWDRVSGLGLGA